MGKGFLKVEPDTTYQGSLGGQSDSYHHHGSFNKVDLLPDGQSSAVITNGDDAIVSVPEGQEVDPWALAEPVVTGKPWKDRSRCDKVCRVLINIVKGCAVALLLYLFICSIDLLGSSFQLLAGRTAGEAFTHSELLNNPVCCLMIGVGVTVLLQSSSTSTSIVVTMVAAQIIPVHQAIYIIMGANIGTSVTNTIVAMGQIADRDQFRRAFAGATVHDMFNWLAVLILLPLEVLTGYLYYITLAIVNTIDVGETIDDEPQFLKVITKPFVDAIIKVDKDVIYGIAEESFVQKRPLTKYLCKEEDAIFFEDFPQGTDVSQTDTYNDLKDDTTHPNYWVRDETVEDLQVPWNETNITATSGQDSYVNVTRFTWNVPIFDEGSDTESCTHWFVGAGLPSNYEALSGWPSLNMSDAGVGSILLLLSLVMLCLCLVSMVKILQSLLQGPVLKLVRKAINANITFPDCCPGCCNIVGKELAGYIAMLVGTGMTILVQSSSVFTSTLTPLVGMGIITVERMYPLTLGANIGTTVTSLLAAFTSDPETIKDALQVSLSHLFFNLTGILIFYPIPFMRRIPVLAAKKLGNTTGKYRWFAVAYLVVVFFLAPFAVFALSIPGWYVLAAVLLPIILIALFVLVVNISQDKCPQCLPKRLKSWQWCPSFLCSLEPYDRIIQKIMCRCCHGCHDDETSSNLNNDNHHQKVGPVDDEVPDIKMQVENGELQTFANNCAVDIKNSVSCDVTRMTVPTGNDNQGYVNDKSSDTYDSTPL